MKLPKGREMAKLIEDFLAQRKGEEVPIDLVADFYERHVNEPNDITEKELYEVYFQPFRFLRWNREFHRSALHFHSYAISRYIYNDFDYVCVRMGTEGKGKSTFQLLQARDLKYLGIDYKLEDVIFRGTSITDVLQILDRSEMSLVWFDEAKAFFDKRTSMRLEQVELLQDITSLRASNNVIALLLGDIDELDKYFRERRAREVVVIPDRKIFITLLNMGITGMGKDRFCLDRWNDQVMTRLDYTFQISSLANLPSAHIIGTFNKVDDEEYRQYVKLKKASASAAKMIRNLRIAKKYKKKGKLEGVEALTKFIKQ